ncbi:MAG: hypothetical protein AUJ18_07930 [Candidatus Hydrogenedentes bacterium CG1_02_42_14]|nr:MAG: hypothetical protein AUJ18_07930 [Candidatus Hydrogenedentes bacterium CG1_02_42_14]
MGRSTRNILFGIMALMMITFPSKAFAATREMWRDERFTANQTGDSLFVARTTHQIIAVGVQPESNVAPPDSFSQMVINAR